MTDPFPKANSSPSEQMAAMPQMYHLEIEMFSPPFPLGHAFANDRGHPDSEVCTLDYNDDDKGHDGVLSLPNPISPHRPWPGKPHSLHSPPPSPPPNNPRPGPVPHPRPDNPTPPDTP